MQHSFKNLKLSYVFLIIARIKAQIVAQKEISRSTVRLGYVQ